MRILVTGASGSLMREVIPRLLERGHDVRGIDNFMRYGRQNPPDAIEFLEGDLTDPATVQRAVRGMDGVIQAAAQIYGVAGFHRYPADILQRDTLLHGLVLRTAVESDIQRVVCISSSMVYERAPAVAREVDVPNLPTPLTDYGLSKLLGERLSQSFAAQYGLDYTIWRPFNIIGLHERAEGQEQGISHVFADFIQRLAIEHVNPLPVIGDGQQVRCFTWIGDVAAAIAEFSFDLRTRNEDFNLGNPEPVTMIELAQRIYALYQRQSGSPRHEELQFVHQDSFSDDVRVRIPDIAKAERELGWRPKTGLDEMLRLCLQHALSTSPVARG